jgi:hypothetical protein
MGHSVALRDCQDDRIANGFITQPTTQPRQVCVLHVTGRAKVKTHVFRQCATSGLPSVGVVATAATGTLWAFRPRLVPESSSPACRMPERSSLGCCCASLLG